MTGVSELLRGEPEVEGRPLSGFEIGCEFLQPVEESVFKIRDFVKSLAGGILNAEMDENRDRCVVRGDPQRLKKVERLSQLCQRQTGLTAEIVRRNSAIGRRVEQAADKPKELRPITVGDIRFFRSASVPLPGSGSATTMETCVRHSRHA